MRKSLWILNILLIGISCSTTESEESRTENIVPSESGFHFSPQHGKKNKTISLFKSDETYHLFYSTGSTEWGHAESPNLIHWNTVSSIELSNDANGDIVVDRYNTSLLSNEDSKAWVMFVSSDDEIDIQYSVNQVDWIPASFDLPSGTTGIPKITWYEPTEKWIMSVVNDKVVAFLSSENLLSWKEESEFSLDEVATAAELFQLKDKWVLLLNGESVQYQLGQFDGSSFISNNQLQSLEQTNSLGSATISDEEQNVIIGQTRNNNLTSSMATSLSEDGESLLLFPIEEFTTQITGKRRGKLKLLRGDKSSWFHFPIDSIEDQLQLLISNEALELLVIDFDLKSNELIVDRKSAVKNKEGLKSIYPLILSKKEIEIDMIIDYQQIELFVNQGEQRYVIETQPNNIYDKIDVKVDGEITSPRTVLYTISPDPI